MRIASLTPGGSRRSSTPIEAGADVSMGWYEPVLETSFERCMAAVNLPLDAGDVDPATFNPSARSVAFRREGDRRRGRLPGVARDRRGHVGRPAMARARHGHAVRARRRRAVATSARAPRTPGASTSGTHAATRRRACTPSATRCGSVCTRDSARRSRPGAPGRGCSRRQAPSRTHGRRCAADGRARATPRERAIATVAVPALMAFTDVAKMAGYAAGLADRLGGAGRPVADPPG